MHNEGRAQLESIEATLAQALRNSGETESSVMLESAPLSHDHEDGYSAQQLLQLAYDSVEDEIDQLRTELRLVRQKHRDEEQRIERRLIQKEALRRKIIEAAPAQDGSVAQLAC